MKKQSDRIIKRCTFEVRYDPAFALWDNAGKIWQELRLSYDGLKSVQVNPNLTSFQLENDFQISVEYERTYVIWYNNKRDEKYFYKLVNDLLRIVQKTLKVDFYKRVGARILFFEAVASKKAGTDLLINYGVISKKEGEFFNIKGEQILPEVTSKWEDDEMGVMVKASVTEITLNIDPPIEFIQQLEAVEKVFVGVNLDVDYYTKSRVSASQLKADEWLLQVKEIVERDLDKFLQR